MSLEDPKPTVDKFRLDIQIACVEREIRFRKRVYPRLVERKKMSGAQMQFEIACMERILQTLQGLPSDEPQQSLLP